MDRWRETYQGIVPDEFLANLSYERREQMWRSGLENPEWKGVMFVAEDLDLTNGVVGFVFSGPPQEPNERFSCELWAIYLLKAFQGQGIGRQMFDRFAGEMVSRGKDSMLWWVLAQNPAVKFYEHMGGVRVLEKEIEISGKKLLEHAYVWNSLEEIAA